METHEVLIIGAGPAGLATAIQLKRYGIAPLIFERDQIGGLLWNANLVENYPGFPAGITGPRLVRLFEQQARRLSIQVLFEEVLELSFGGGLFQVTTARHVYHSRVAVIASGTKPREVLDLSIPPDLQKRISYEVHPRLGLQGQRIAIIGAGDAAFDYALNLGRENDVIILNRSVQTSCLPLLRERASASPRITYCPNMRVTRIAGTPSGDLKLDCTSFDGVTSIYASYIIIAVGRDPQLDFISSALLEQAEHLHEQGILYIIGDVKNGIYRQTAIAVGEGVLAAMKIHQYLKELSE
jgi:thioredoxin reductase